MKRYGAIVISLLAVVGLVTGVSGSLRKGQPMQVRFNKRDLPKHGLHIITSADPNFDALASNYFKNRSAASNESLKPLSVFIQNRGSRMVVAYVLEWRMLRTDGQVLTNTNSYSEPGILMGHEMPTDPRFKHTQAIEPNEIRAFTWSTAVNPEGASRLGSSNTSPSPLAQVPQADALRAQLDDELSGATDLTVSLDGVFFEDGEFVGPNATGFFERTQALVSAKLDLIRDIAMANENGKLDQAFEVVASKYLSPAVTLTPESTPAEYYKYYTRLFAEEITNMESVYGKQRLATYLTNQQKRARSLFKKP
jgi:hypothetical protein